MLQSVTPGRWSPMVILLTPFMLTMAIVQAPIDSKRLAMNIIGAIVSLLILTKITCPPAFHQCPQL